jgi:hypothetical protein
VAVSDWKYRHLFSGGCSGPSTFGTSLSLGRIAQHGKGKLALPYNHWKEGSGLLVIDEDTLQPVGIEPQVSFTPRYPKELTKVTSDFPGMRVKWCDDSGTAPDPATRYVLRWETLGSNRDRPREGKLPENSDLVLYRIGSGME